MAVLRGDQLEVANRLLALLSERGVAGLQAPTGWGKSFVASFVIKSLGGKWVWTSSLINALTQASRALREFGVRYFLSTGRERLCLRGFRHSDFIIRKPCGFCQFNKPVPKPLVKALINAVDYGDVRETAEQSQLCPYSLQEALIKELISEHEDLVVLMNYSRLGKFARKFNGVIIDEAHNAVIPRIVSIPRRSIEVLFNRLGVEGVDAKNAELVKGVLSELLLTIAMDGETNELISLDDLVAIIESSIAYFDLDSDSLIGVKFEGLELPSDKRVLLMSATLPPSILSSMLVVKVEPNRVIRAVVGDLVMTAENLERLRGGEVTRRINELLSDGLPTVVFTTSSKEVFLENAVYEDELRRDDVCRRNLVLRFFGKYAEGVRLNCYKRVILLTLPLLPSNVMRRLEVGD
ncbi:hypothetical protein [Vulcanisaeta distributa]|uniref:hypothetical protein n=1 Tax=Vulcanisaeta distributa TaxID=164451 RepID=UPI000ADB3BFC|nr:hypothetical protein [Vulcanisaeta distributa]